MLRFNSYTRSLQMNWKTMSLQLLTTNVIFIRYSQLHHISPHQAIVRFLAQQGNHLHDSVMKVRLTSRKVAVYLISRWMKRILTVIHRVQPLHWRHRIKVREFRTKLWWSASIPQFWSIWWLRITGTRIFWLRLAHFRQGARRCNSYTRAPPRPVAPPRPANEKSG